MSDFKFDGDEWNGGRIKDIRTCKSFDAYIKIEDKNVLKASGYMYFRFLNETMVFTRYLSAVPKK
jgi:hypothetical protein